jgi:molecular chaperone DnaJ
MDYYELLGITKSATQDEVKKAFHKLAHKHHPDKGGDEKKFKEINEAYQVLSDTSKRQQYDQFGRTFDQAGAGGGQGFNGQGFDFNWAWGNRAQGQDSEQEFEFEDLGSVFGDLFGFGGGARRATKKDGRKGKDIQVDMEINLEDTLKETIKKFNLNKFIVCQRCAGAGAEPGTKVKECFSCRGSGQVQQVKKTMFGSYTTVGVCPACKGEGNSPEKPCNVCRGEGRIKGNDEIEITIPSGVDTNQVIKVEGKGEAGKKAGKAGALYIRVFVKQHPVFIRRGDDLFMQEQINFTQAVLGSEIEIPVLEGAKILLTVPEGTESGKVLRVSGKGTSHFQSHNRGNLYVELKIKTPKKLTREQRKVLQDLKNEGL